MRRTIGVLLKHQNDPLIRRKILSQSSPDLGYQIKSIKGIYPEFDVPEPEKLVYGVVELEMRIKVLNFIFQMEWTEKDFQKTPTNTIAFVLALDVCEKKAKVHRYERNFIWSCLQDMLKKNVIPDFLPPVENVSYRAVQIVFKFLVIYNLVIMILKTIGLKEFAIMLPFDGVHYQHIYNNNSDW